MINGRREDELIILGSTLLLSMLASEFEKPKIKTLEISEDGQWYFFVNKNGETEKLPSTRPYNSKFSASSIEKLKYVREFGAAGVGASATIGAMIDFVISNADTVIDGSGTAIITTLLTLVGLGIYNSVKKTKCPYCSEKHKSNLKICPNTDMMIWFWEEQQPVDKFRRNTLNGPAEIEEVICKNYYPICNTDAKRIALEIIQKNPGPIQRDEFIPFLKREDFDSKLRKLMLQRIDKENTAANNA